MVDLWKFAANLPGVIYQFQQWDDGRFAMPYASSGLVDIYGVEPEDVKHDVSAVFSKLHPEDQPLVQESIRESSRTLQPWRHRFRVCHPQHGLIWVDGEASPEKLPDGSILWHGYNRDVTEQVKAYEKQASDSRRLQLLLELASDGVHVLNNKGNVVACSRQFARQLGYEPNETIGMNVTVWDALIPADQLIDVVNELIESPRTFETVHRRKDGSVFPVEISGSAVEFDGEKHFYASARDITPRKEDQHKVEQASARYRSVIDSTKDGYIVVADSGKIIDCNAVFCSLFGYSREEVLELKVTDIHLEETDEKVQDRMGLIQERGSAQFDAQYRCKDGSYIPVELSVSYSPLTPDEFFVFVRDIRARHIDRQFAELRAELADRVVEANEKNLLRVAIDAAEKITNSGIGFFHFFREDEQSIELSTWSTKTVNGACGLTGVEMHYPLGEAGVWADTARLGQSIIQNDYEIKDNPLELPEGHAPLHRGLYCPVIRNHKVVAIMGVGNKALDYDQQDLMLVQQVAEIAYDYVERSFTEQKVQRMAYTDTLTDLPNRRLLMDRLEQAIALARREDKLVAVCYLDLDDFKPVNDRLGHEFGDQVLIEFTTRVKKELRQTDTLARIGGDEFVLLLSHLEAEAAATAIIRRILEVSRQPFKIHDQEVRLSASIGVAFFPNDDLEPDGLIRRADHAMYQAKNLGRNTFALYSAAESTKAQEQNKFLAELALAIAESELVLHFQPRIKLDTGELAGFEALVRWEHPERGLLFPDEFLPLIDGMSLQWELDRWVLCAALQAQQRWEDAGHLVPVSVNMSSYSLQVGDLAAEIRTLLDGRPQSSSGILELEILEQSSIEDTETVVQVMQQCADIGVQFSLDDFGTGFSSLAYFHQLPIDVVKIDRGFVQNMIRTSKNQSIVEGVLGLAAAIGRPVVGEGVESIELGLMLAFQGCQFAQGYAIAKPMPEQSIFSWIQEWECDSNEWKSLTEQAGKSTPHYDLNVAIFSQRRWLKKMLEKLRSSTSSGPDAVSTDMQMFDEWLAGIGCTQYETRTCWPDIIGIRTKMTSQISALLQGSDFELRSKNQDEIRRLSQELEVLLLSLPKSASAGKSNR